jgi:hypothetical protein
LEKLVFWLIKARSLVNVLREDVPSIFIVKEQAEQQTSLRKAASTTLAVASSMLVCCLAYLSNPKMEVICSSETLAGLLVYWAVECYISEDRIL